MQNVLSDNQFFPVLDDDALVVIAHWLAHKVVTLSSL